jgi:hypothetical protein
MAKDDVAVVEESSGVIQPAVPRFTDDELRSITSAQDALAMLKARFGEEAVIRADTDMGNGFRIADDDVKDSLCGMPLVFISWDFTLGKYLDSEGKLRDFCTAFVVADDGGKWILNDGSTGLCKQLSEETERTGRQNFLVAPNGLNRTDYQIGTIDGRKVAVPRNYEGPTEPAHTYYIDTSGRR